MKSGMFVVGGHGLQCLAKYFRNYFRCRGSTLSQRARSQLRFGRNVINDFCNLLKRLSRMMKSISGNNLPKLLVSGKTIELIDVRTPNAFRAMHVMIAPNEPPDCLDPKAIQAAGNSMTQTLKQLFNPKMEHQSCQ